MEATIPGYEYSLAHHEGTGAERLCFIRKEERDGEFVTVANGTTNEEVIKVLINRITFLNQKMPHQCNDIALMTLASALRALEIRTALREARGVEGTPKP